ncbi:hypothetical protein FHS90_004234 [Rufibacter quisquiliarum]|uniref:Uncharacterized protein n=1 Tax=Rufibacter quisquiliarum TaxID=1549639 RepID=A0A839GXP7_9BACT|nr:hypothetical protein [Rufibacter quisquiliarum]
MNGENFPVPESFLFSQLNFAQNSIEPGNLRPTSAFPFTANFSSFYLAGFVTIHTTKL